MMPQTKKVDPDLRQDVLCEIAWDARVAGKDVGVLVRKGVVTLVGTVDNWATARAAERAAHRVQGVLDVANDLVVKLPDDHRRTDAEVAQAVRHAIERDVLGFGVEIASTVSNGIVTLEGKVSTESQKRTAEAAVSHLLGVLRVIDRINVQAAAAPPPAEGLAAVVTARLAKRGGVPPSRARHSDVAAKVRDVMTTHGLIEVQEGTPLAVAAHRMSWQGCRHLPVTRKGQVVGVLSDGDLLRWRADGHSLDGPGDLVRAAMSTPALVATPDEDLSEAAARMIASRIGCLPVVLHGRLVGVLTSVDLLGRHVARAFEPTSGDEVRVADLMTPNVLTASTDDQLLEVADMMAWKGVRHLPIVDADGRLAGIISERDLRTALGVPSEALAGWGGALGRDRTAGEVMSQSVECVRPDQPLSQVVAAMVARNVGALPVVDAEGRPVGIISYLDVLGALRGAVNP